MTVSHRIRLTLISLFCGAAIVLGMAMIGYTTARGEPADAGVLSAPSDAAESGSAVAPPLAAPGSAQLAVPVVIVDPLSDPGAAVSTVSSLWKNGTIPAAIIVATFMLLTILDKKKVLKGRQAVAVSALLAGAMVLIERAAAGTTPNAAMFLTAGVTSIALFMRPEAKKPPEA